MGPLGGGPEDPEGEPEESGTGGWIPPDARAWRHPSELASGFGPPSSAVENAAPIPHSRRATVMTVAATTAAAISLGVLLLANAAAGPPEETTALTVSTAAVTQCCRLAPQVAAGTLDAVVSLLSTRSGRRTGYGVLVGNGGLVATTIRALASQGGVTAATATGQEFHATLVGTDPGSGVALLR